MGGKIGVIDSGLGGLTIAKEIMRAFPEEEVIFVGDTARCPYGNKEKEQIRSYVWELVDFLCTKEIKALVIACNTATSILLDELKEKLPFPVLGVIAPAAHHAIDTTKTKQIAVLATTKTIESNAYETELKKWNKMTQVYSLACPTFVPMIEGLQVDKQLIKETVKPLFEQSFDTVILGCTHFPLLKQELSEIFGKNISLVDSSSYLIQSLKEIANNQHNHPSEHEFYVTGEPLFFREKAKKLLNLELSVRQLPLTDKTKELKISAS